MTLDYRAPPREVHVGDRFAVLRVRGVDGADVIIKQVRSGADERRSAERLRHEHEILRMLDGAGTPKALQLANFEGKPALYLSDVGTQNLAERMSGRALPIDVFLDLAIGMVDLVRQVHARQVIHRDICPENFVIDPSRATIALVDFECATTVPVFAQAQAVRGELEGTLAYMAPEQTGRMRRSVDLRADLYALGATFYEMLIGQPPFSCRDLLELVQAHAARAPYPPAIVDPRVPTMLSDIVVMLLAKMPEWRYQSAEALAADLEEVRRQWRERGAITRFELGRLDLPYELFLETNKLYGRDEEKRILAEAIDRTSSGASELVILTGPPGIGKSALADGVRELATQKARWITGRGDLLRENVPYAPFIDAFGKLVRTLAGQPATVVAALRERIERATAPNGRMLVNAIPELRALLGEQPRVPKVGAIEAENRFQLVFTSFVRALLEDGPLVLFLDDLQWVDAASLTLLHAITLDPDIRSLLVLGGCRSEALVQDGAIAVTLGTIRAAGAPVTQLELGPLDSDSLLALLSDALRAAPASVLSLAELVRRKTASNPFFVRQFLGYLYRKRLLVLDVQEGRWTWDLSRIESADLTPNVVELLSNVIGTLPVETQHALRVAACIGNRFELALLAHLLGQPAYTAAKALWAPVQQGLLVPAVEVLRHGWALDGQREREIERTPVFRFVHDRIQQAAYEGLPEDERKDLHLRIGRWLEERVPKEFFPAAVCAIVAQLNRAADLLPEAERVRVATLDDSAGRQARREGALRPALGYFQAGRNLLPPEAWRGEHHALWFALLRNAAECAGLSGERELGERLVNEVLSLTESALEKAELCTIGAQVDALYGAHDSAITRSREGLRVLGMELPKEESAEVVRRERERARDVLRERSDRQLLEVERLEDPIDCARLELLVNVSSSWFIRPELFQIAAARAVALTAARGTAPGSSVAYGYYATALAMTGDYEEASRYAHLGVQLAQRLALPAEECRALVILGGHVSGWRAPLADSLPMLARAHALGVAGGDLEFAAYALANLVYVRMASGTELNRVLIDAQSTLAFYRKVHHLSGVPYVQPFVQAVRCLRGLTRAPSSFDDDSFDEARYFVEAAQNGLGQAVFHTLRAQTCYLLGNPELAWKYVTDGIAWVPWFRTIYFQVEFHFYAALTAARLGHGASALERERFLARLREHLAALETWARSAPTNFAHKCELVAAELAQIEARSGDAVALYHDAIEHAGREGVVQDEALAHELCARFHRLRNSDRLANLHLDAAIEGFSVWGATAKVERLSRDRPALRLRRTPVAAPSVSPVLDYYTLIKVSEALTEELDFDPLLTKLVRTSGEAADAERTVLVLDERGLVVRAIARVGEGVTLLSEPISTSLSVPKSVLTHVFRSKEALVLGDAAHESRFASDPYVAEHGVRSVMVVPLVRRNEAVGVLYFENNLTTDAFSGEPAEMFQLLSAQMAIALENSRLFEQRKRSESALRRISETSLSLTETLDYDGVLAKLVRVVVPSLAEWCVVDVIEDGVLRPVSWAHVDPEKAPAVQELHTRYRVEPSSPQPQNDVLRSNASLLVAEVTDEFLRSRCRDEEHLRLLRSLEPRSLIIVPLAARGRSIGTVTLARSARRYDETDLALAEEVVRRFGMALDNARLHRDLSEALRQREERDRYLRMIFRQLPGAVWAIDRGLRVTYGTGRLLNVMGVDEHELIGTSAYDFLGTRDPSDAVIARHLAALQGEAQSFEYEFRGRYYAVLMDPICDADRQVVGCVGAAFDITEQREMTERLTRSERRLREAQQLAHVGSFEWDIRPNLLTWSDELQRMYGFEPGTFGGTFEAFMERLPAGEMESTRKVIFDAYARLRPFSYDHRIVRTDGATRILHSRGDVIKDEHGKPLRMVGTCWDVTEQRALVAQLEQAISRWEATINATAEGILATDLEGDVRAVNQRFMALWRLPVMPTGEIKHRELLVPVLEQLEDPDAFVLRIDEVYAHKEQASFDVIRFQDGRVFERYSTPQWVATQIIGRVWSVRDVTQRETLLHRALFLADATRLLASLDVEQALQAVARLAVPYLGDGCTMDLLGDGEPRRLAAISRDPQMPMALQVHPSVLAGHPVIYRAASISHIGVPLMTKGHVVGAITCSAPPHRNYTTSDLELGEELARRAALAIENARLYRHAQEALRARDEFLSIAAHEIRGPINAIHLAVQSIREANVPAEAMPRLFEIVERQDRRLAKFVDELLDLGRIRAGRLQLEYEDVNLGDVISEVAARLGPELARSGSSLTVTAHTQVVGQWDKSRVDQVVSNLLSNAVKFGLGKPIEIAIGTRAELAVLVVKDHGMGIEPELRERLFEPFERGVSLRHYGGLGLGLHIVSKIAEALGGTVRVASEPGAGSTFTVELPARRMGAERDAHPDHR